MSVIDRPCSWVGVHEKGGEMRILYVSSNIKRILDYDPGEMIGQPAWSFVTSDLVPAYANDFGQRTSENVSVGYTRVERKDGTSFAIRVISFACSDIQFNVGSFDPSGSFERLLETTRVQWFQYATKDSARSETLVRIQQALGNSGADGEPTSQTAPAPSRFSSPPVAAAPVVQACLILNNLHSNTEAAPLGPQIVFATNSMTLIISSDASDLHGVPFLSLVAPSDVVKAGEFLQRVASKPDVTFTMLNILNDPLQDSGSAGSGNGRSESMLVEVMGIGSECGGILLCQPVRAER
ncbi:hypothetical protein FBU59_001778, partial [Linderina macrospora]